MNWLNKKSMDKAFEQKIENTVNEIGEKVNGLIVKIYDINEKEKTFDFDIQDSGDNETEKEQNSAVIKAINIMEKNLYPYRLEI